MKRLAIKSVLAAALLCLVSAAPAAEPAPLKVTAGWNIPMTEAGIRDTVTGAKDLGFNAYAWTSTRLDEIFLARCRANGLRCFKVLVPLARRPGARMQVLAEADRTLPGAAAALPAEYQYGGEPLPGYPEVLNQELVCPLDDGIVPYVAAEVARAARQGYQGICWDFIGYRNYRSCNCEACRTLLKAFMRKNPHLRLPQAEAAFYQKALTDLYARIYDAARSAAPGITVLSHVHPAFLPNPFYGAEAKLDYCAVTASWFFQPHWPLNKVREYARRTVRGPYSFPGETGIPMIGIYSSGAMSRHCKTGARVKAEFEVLRRAGARAVMVCELGDILSDPELRDAVRTGLAALR